MPTLDMWRVGAGRVGRVDRVAHLGEHERALVDLARIGASGGFSSAVTAKRPERSTRSSRPREQWPGQRAAAARPDRARRIGSWLRRRRGHAARCVAHELSQAERPLRRLSTGFCTSRILPCRHPLRALPGLHPDARHLRLHLAMAVGAHAAAGPVAEVLRAVHRAGHAGRGERALAAHLAIEQQPLHPRARGRRPDARAAHGRASARLAPEQQQGLEALIEGFELAGMAHGPEADGVHGSASRARQRSRRVVPHPHPALPPPRGRESAPRRGGRGV